MAKATDVRVFSGLMDCALQFSSIYPNSKFIPCYRNGKDNKKPPCKGVKAWQEKQYSAQELQAFPRMEMLALYLGDDFFVFDCDAGEAIDALDSLAQLHPLPETLEISSGKEGRKSLFYRINKPLNILYEAPVRTLEFRTGAHYQVIAGLHPSGSVYKQNGKAIAELPDEWIEFLSKSDFLPENNDLVILQTFLNDALDHDFGSPEYYDSWLNIGMIIHDLDDSDEGLKTWIEWSKQSTRHDADEAEESCTQKWSSFGDCDNPVTLGTLIHKIRESRGYKKNAEEVEEIIKPLEAVAERKGVKSDFLVLPTNFGDIDLEALKLAKQRLGFNSPQYAQVLAFESQIIPDYDEDTIEDYQQAIQRLLTVDELDIDDLIGHTSFGQLLQVYGASTGRPLDYTFMSFLTSYASCLPKGLFYRVDQDQKTKPILFTVFVGNVASGKGIITSPFTDPLMRLSKDSNNLYMEEKQRHNKELDNYRKMPKAERFESYLAALGQFEGDNVDLQTQLEVLCPEPKQPHFPYLSMVTPERLRSISGELKDYGFLVAPEEIHSLFNYMSRYSKDAGSNDLLLAWDGATTQTNLQGEQFRTVDFYQLSILSGIQGKRFADIFNLEDPSGMLSRFLWLPIQQPIRLKRSEDSEPGLDISHHFLDLYQQTQNLIQASWAKPLIVEPSKQAKKLWVEWEDSQYKKAATFQSNHQGFSAWLSRNPQYTARIALILNCFFAQELSDPFDVLNLETMEKAIKLSSWLERKAQLVYEAHEDHIDPVKARIHSDLLMLIENKYSGKVYFKQLTSNAFLKRAEVKSVYCSDINRRKEGTKALNKKEVAFLFQEMALLKLGVFNAEECSFTIEKK